LKAHFNIILQFTPRASCSLRFPHSNPAYTTHPQYTCYIPHHHIRATFPANFFLILSSEYQWVRSKDEKVLPYVVFSNRITSSFLGSNIFLGTPFQNILS
jgi:hypothetical protein